MAILSDNDEFSSGTWTAKTSMTTARAGAGSGMGLEINGKGYVFCGLTASLTDDVEEYVVDSWTSKTGTGQNGVKLMYAGHIGTKGYIAAGFDTDSAYIVTTREYDPTADSWTTKTNKPTPGSTNGWGHTIASTDSRLYAMAGDQGGGGDANIKDNDEYEVSGNSWTSKTDVTLGSVGSSVGRRWAG